MLTCSTGVHAPSDNASMKKSDEWSKDGEKTVKQGGQQRGPGGWGEEEGNGKDGGGGGGRQG